MKSRVTEWLGVQVLSVTRIGNGRSSENWRVKTEEGEQLLLKRVSPSHEANLARQVDVMTAVGSPWAPRLFRGRQSWSTAEGLMLAEEWIKGRVVRFENLKPKQAESLGRAYRAFSDALQRYTGPLLPTRLPEIPEAEQKVIHGDLNDANVLFDGEQVSAFIDYEMVRRGLPAEDVVRGFIHRAERLSPLAIFRQRRLVRNFQIAAQASGFSKDDFRLAVMAYRRRKQGQRCRRHSRIVSWFESIVRDPVYRRFEQAVEGLPTDFAPMRASYKLEKVGWGGTRRICLKVGETGHCVKFYWPREYYASEAIPRGIQAEIERKRFDLRNNACAQEVRRYESFWLKQSQAIRDKLLPRVELVFDPEWGYGILETYFTNPDGTAIIPYEFEIKRQTSKETQREILRQAEELLDVLAKVSAPFYEPGNFHSLLLPDGRVETKIVDFEPTPKTAIPIEKHFAFWRRMKLRRKTRRYLKHIRETYEL